MINTDILETINEKLTGGGCPVAGKSLGECAALSLTAGFSRYSVWEAYIYLWDDDFTDWGLLAQWFTDAGAIDVVVSWVMHDQANGDRNGRTEEDDARAITVTYVIPVARVAAHDERYSCGVLNCGNGECVHELTDEECPCCGHRMVRVKPTGFMFCSNPNTLACDYEKDSPDERNNQGTHRGLNKQQAC